MKKQQTAIPFLAFTALLFVTALHAPWTGYETDYPAPPIDAPALLQQCQAAGKSLDPGLGAAVVRQRVADEMACVAHLRPQPRMLPFPEWRSQSPLLPYFGSVLHVGAVALAILALLLHSLLCWRSRAIEDT